MLRLAAVLLLCLAGSVRAEELAPGARAPEWRMPGSDGRTWSLSQLVARRGVVLAWFPKAFTPGCTQELLALQQSAEALAAFDVAVFLVSLDEPERNREFAESLEARHVLLSDPDGAAARAYGVLAPGGGVARRWTYYIGRDGVIRAIDKDVKVESAGQDIARRLGELGFERR